MILHGVPTFSLHPMPRVSHGFAGFYAPVHEPASDGAAENPPEAAGPLAKQAGEPPGLDRVHEPEFRCKQHDDPDDVRTTTATMKSR